MFKASLLALSVAAPTALAFNQYESRQSDPTQLSIIDEVGTTPCIFKLGDSFYDFTPFKIKFPNPIFPYVDGEPMQERDNDLKNPNYWFVFGWCQHIDEAADQKYCLEDIYAGRIDGPEPKQSAECTPYSGGDHRHDI